MQYLVLVRHGETLSNVVVATGTDSLYYSLSGSDKSISLTEKGRLEISQVGITLSRIFGADNRISTITTSTYWRTQETADLICEHLPYTPQRQIKALFDKRAYGDFWNITYKGVEQLYPDEYKKSLAEGPLDYQPPNGESYKQLFARVDEGLLKLSTLPGNHLVVCHSVVFLALQRQLEGLSEGEVYRQYEQNAVPNGHLKFYKRHTACDAWQTGDIV